MEQPSALVLMHLQNDVIDPDGEIGRRGNAVEVERRGLIANTRALLRAARQAGMTVVHIGSGYEPGSEGLCANVPLFAHHAQDRRATIGTWAAAFHPDLAPEGDDISFYHFGVVGFEGTPLAKILGVRGITRFYLAGVSTHYAILATTFSAADRGYAVTVVEDCCAAATPELHDAAMVTIANFARTATAGAVMTTLSGDRGLTSGEHTGTDAAVLSHD
jgi:nicotinamidase-related amidase